MKLKRILCVVLALAAFFSLSVGLSAQTDGFVFSEDGKTLTFEGTTYYRYDGLSMHYLFHPQTLYYAPVSEGGYGFWNEEKTVVVFMDFLYGAGMEAPDAVYVTEERGRELDRFVKEAAYGHDSYVLHDDWSSAGSFLTVNVDFLTRAWAEERSFLLSYLAEMPCYPIYTFDQAGEFAYCRGAVYNAQDSYWFVEYPALDEDLFYSHGVLNDVGGSVTGYSMEDAVADVFEQSLRDDIYMESYLMDGPSEMLLSDGTGTVIVVSLLVLVGILLPAIPLTLGLTLGFSHRKKDRGFVRWFVLAGLSALCILIAVALLLLFLL